jgi:hypothetical protein
VDDRRDRTPSQLGKIKQLGVMVRRLMNRQYIRAIATIGLIFLAGCNATSANPNTQASNTITPSQSPLSVPPAATEERSPTPPPQVASAPLMAQRTPSQSSLPVGSVSELQGDTTCEGTGGILAYAETENFLIYICSDRNDATQPRYYRSFDRDGTPGIRLEATDYDPRQMRYFEFKNEGYSYLLQMPMGATPNPMLTVIFPDGSAMEEAITRYLTKRS